MDVDAYLQRVDYQGSRNPTLTTLVQLHRAHLYSVPFENLDIHLNRPIVLSLPSLFAKIVVQRRGGFCYELNGIFAWLLRQLGFQLEMLSGRVFGSGTWGPEFDHMLLLVDIGERFIADVGFGDSFIDPLRLTSEPQGERGRCYRLLQWDTTWELHRKEQDTEWQPQYRFSLRPRRLEDFQPMCLFQQTSPDSVFTQKSVCSLATPTGRVTLSNGRLIITADGDRQDRKLNSLAEYTELLGLHFGMDLGEIDAGKWQALSGPR